MKLKTIATLIAIGATSLVLQAHAQSATPPAQQTGQAYPNDPNAANPNKPKAEVVKKVENSNAVQATKRTAKKAGGAVKRTAKKAAGGVRGVGEKIGKKLPPAPNPPTDTANGPKN